MNIFELIWEVLRSIVETFFGWILPARYKSVEGEICLVTGAGNGIGRLLAIEFAQRKAKLILWDIDKRGNEETADMVREVGAPVFADVCDLSDKQDVKRAAKKAREQFGDITILVNNAGIAYGKDLMKLTDHQIEQTYKVNTLAHFWTLRQFLPSMMKRNRGHIVTTASIVGLFAVPGTPDYVSSKHAAVGLHQSLYLDLQRDGYTGIKTTLVCPYLIHTGLFAGVSTNYDWLLPGLQPSECVKAIMHAVLTDRPFVAIPRTMYLMYNSATWMPMRLQAALCKFMGFNEAIQKLVPKRKYQVEAHKT